MNPSLRMALRDEDAVDLKVIWPASNIKLTMVSPETAEPLRESVLIVAN